MSSIFLQLLAMLFLTASCKKDSKNEETGGGDPGTVTKGYVKGKVTDTQGQPVKGVSIIIDNTLIPNSNLVGVTGDDGTYSIRLTNFTWQAYAEKNISYNGQTYKIHFHPDNNDGFNQEGAIRNFQWKLTGEKPDQLGYYGGTIMIDKHILSEVYDSENIEFTLTPNGPLIDGSAGQVIKARMGQPATATYGKLVDIPIGRYTMTASYQGTAGNVSIKLRDKGHFPSGAFSSSITLDIDANTSYGNNMAFVDYTEK
ncbi:MAG TPA: carboxypeptidase-like regulatory domain-containing protein [Chitinophagaceae bacterium]|nr:carboxypeptidase-like regulatory domain-containing protein [Chitinophagaceae bacterium]